MVMDSYDIPVTPQPVSARVVFAVVRRRLWIIVLLLAASLGTAAYLTHVTPPRWRAVAQLMLIQRSATVVGSVQQGNAAPMVESTETQIALLSSYSMAQRAIDWMRSDAVKTGAPTEDIPDNPETFTRQISATPVRDTDLIDVSVEAESRPKAERLATAVCNAFVEWKAQVQKQDVQDTLHNLETRESRAKEQALEAERKETDFKLRHHLVDVPAQLSATLKQYLDNDSQVSVDKQDLYSQEARLDAIKKRLGDTNKNLRDTPEVRDDSQVVALQQQLNQLEVDRYNQSLRVTEQYPGILPELDKRIADIKQRLATAIRNTLDEKKPSLQTQGTLYEDFKQAQVNLVFTQAKFNALVKERDSLRARLASVPTESMEYAKLAHAMEEARAIHSALMTSLNVMRIDSDTTNGNVQISQYPTVPTDPFEPNPGRNMLAGSAVGLALAIACVLLMEQGDRRIRDVDQVRRLAPGSVIGMLPKLAASERRALLNGSPSPHVAETYSLACANLALAVRKLGAVNPVDPTEPQIILVTSALPGEGKSVTAALLARSLATTGKQTILVDADLRRPTQNKLFQTEEPIGLADVLEGRTSLNDALIQSDVPGLRILHSGTAQGFVTTLICQPAMGTALQTLRNMADFVVVDAPACSVVADALFLAPHATCILHVTSVGMADEDLVRDTINALKAAAPATMAHFVNRAPRDRNHVYRSYYRYGYHGSHRNGTSGGTGATLTAARTAVVMADNDRDNPADGTS
jgi:capsular exopolysaccharide synthesis family protein